MARAAPADTVPDDLAQAYSAALSAEGYDQAGLTPDIWYFNLVYFTGPIRDAQALRLLCCLPWSDGIPGVMPLLALAQSGNERWSFASGLYDE